MADLGPLAAALAKAQTQFPPITRDKHVVVQKKDGGSYSFDYAPLDSIIAAVRVPLADNGLAVAQVLDDGDLITMLMHDSGAVLSGRVSLPATDNIQGLGSAITYLRRYALQAVLGIAAEEDDDGNHAIGGSIAPRSSSPAPRPVPSPRGGGAAHTDGPWEGPVSFGKPPTDGHVRETPDGSVFGFVITEAIEGKERGRRNEVVAAGAFADALDFAFKTGKPESAMVWGRLEMVPWDKDGKAMPPYRRIHAERVMTPDWTLPATQPVAGDSVAPSAAPNDLDDLPW